MQKHGWGQFAFNIVGLALLGAVVEERMRRTVMLLTFLAAGVGSAVLLGVTRPELVDAGTSDSVAGFVGLLTIYWLRRDSSGSPPVEAFAYSAFFAVYLAVIDLLPLAFAIGVALAFTGVLTSVRLTRSARVAAVSLAVVVAVATGVLCVERDGHGFGLAIGLAIGLVLNWHRGTDAARRASPG